MDVYFSDAVEWRLTSVCGSCSLCSVSTDINHNLTSNRKWFACINIYGNKGAVYWLIDEQASVRSIDL